MKQLYYLILAIIMGYTYYFLEILFRGYSHWSMFILGGICGILIDLINEYKYTWDMPLWKQLLWGELIVLPLEFLTGCIVNLWFGWNVWNYSKLRWNILGQTSPLFALIFSPVILLAIFMGDYYRWIVMGETKPHYKIF